MTEPSNSVSARTIDWLNRPLILCLLLAAVTFVVFSPVIHFNFVTLDDGQYISHNPMVLAGMTTKGVSWAFGATWAGNWHPLTWISHMADTAVFGRGPAGPHLTNLALHIANSLLVFLLLRDLTCAHWRSAIAAAFFALHPLRVESVAWISERKDVLSAFFFFLTLMAYARYVASAEYGGRAKPETRNLDSERSPKENSEESKPRTAFFYLLSIVFFALGLMSKPMVVTLPLVLLLLDLWPLGRIELPLRAAPPARWRQLLAEKLPFLALSAVLCLVTFFVQKKGGSMSALAQVSTFARIQNAVVSYFRYLAKTFWPTKLAVIYPHPGYWPWYEVIGSFLVIAFVTIVIFAFARKFPLLLVGWLWFVGMLVPVIGIVQVGAQSMADRYSYLPSVGLSMVLVWGTFALVRGRTFLTAGAVVVTLLILIASSVRTFDQLQYWRDGDALARRAISVSTGNFVAWNMLGMAMADKGQLAEAKVSYEKSIELRPDFAEPFYNLGNLLAREGRLQDALKYYQDALAINPEFADALNNLGTALNRLGRDEEAIAAYRRALTLRPGFADAALNLGTALAMTGEIDEAVLQVDRALQAAPKFAEAHNLLGYLLSSKGRTRQAEQHYREALVINPDYADALNNLAYLLTTEGRFDEAVDFSRRAVMIMRGSAESFRNLGAALAGKESFNEAATSFEAALKLDPNDPSAHFQLASALLRLNQRQAAIAHLNEALRLKPDFMKAKEQLRSLGIQTD